ncbi:MAG: nucleotidyltransferase [Clostridiales bacterium GWE2_32_10]|nr:MAG: nucleotidyltransferase [Clostridiales bacterium GWE2_32_10]HBY21621.1 nucleotidyltransferase domain-containing protein [Clostridiales bacterium]
MLSIEDKKKELVKYFEKKSNIIAVWIVGSYGTEYQREDSDVDFAIIFDGDVDLMDELRIGTEITDIIKNENVDIINLKESSLSLQYNAVSDGTTLYERDFIQVSDYIENIYRLYFINKYYIDSYNRDYLYSGYKRGAVKV